jgi:hypothetical protein
MEMANPLHQVLKNIHVFAHECRPEKQGLIKLPQKIKEKTYCF